MTLTIPRVCPRGRDDCIALSNLISDDLTTFFCCGENNGTGPPVEQDKFTLCFKGEFRDQTSYHDKRDLTHQASVIAQSLGVIEKSYDEDRDWSPWN